MSLSHCTHSSTDDFMSASDGVPLRLQSQGALDTTMHMGDSVASRCPSTTDRVEGFERSGSSAERRKPNGALFLHARKPSTKHKRLSLSTGRPSGETSALAIARRHPSIDAQLHPTQTGTVAVEVDSDWVDPYDLNAIKFNTRFLLKELKPGSERGWKAQPVSIATPKGRQGVNMSPYASRPEGTLPLNPKRKPESQDDTRHIEGMSGHFSRSANAAARRTLSRHITKVMEVEEEEVGLLTHVLLWETGFLGAKHPTNKGCCHPRTKTAQSRSAMPLLPIQQACSEQQIPEAPRGQPVVNPYLLGHKTKPAATHTKHTGSAAKRSMEEG